MSKVLFGDTTSFMDGTENKHHVSQAFNLPNDADLDFFDANLFFDSPVFIDPFLIKDSPNPQEAELFDRFGDYFQYAYDQFLEFSLHRLSEARFKRLLAFHEPKNINMGYTEESNAGKGTSLSKRLFQFFLNDSSRRFVRETRYFPEQKYNPVSLQVFADGIGPDGISDISANLIMDYLITYTQEQARIWGIPLNSQIALQYDGFDFDTHSWRGGRYYELPENPFRPGEPFLLVPRRLIRGFEEVNDNPISKVFSILRADPELSVRFSSLLEKAMKRVEIDEIRAVFAQEGSVHFRYLQVLEAERNTPYDLDNDPLNILSDKDYSTRFTATQVGQINSCDDLKAKVELLISEFNREFSLRDGWKDAWKRSSREPGMSPQTEPVIGRRFRGMGYAFFSLFNDVTFVPEAGTGNGLVDFHIIYGSCRIIVELKLLNNSSTKGTPPISAYLHGIQRQLPNYIELVQAKHAYYITGQHFDGSQWNGINHTPRLNEVIAAVPIVERDLKTRLSYFESLNHVNVMMTPHGSASTL